VTRSGIPEQRILDHMGLTEDEQEAFHSDPELAKDIRKSFWYQRSEFGCALIHLGHAIRDTLPKPIRRWFE
jgi:hypothetical protein